MKRLAAGLLWFYSLWYLGSMTAAILGVPDLLGPVVGIVGGLLVFVDPRHVIWGVDAERSRARLRSLPRTAASNPAR